MGFPLAFEHKDSTLLFEVLNMASGSRQGSPFFSEKEACAHIMRKTGQALPKFSGAKRSRNLKALKPLSPKLSTLIINFSPPEHGTPNIPRLLDPNPTETISWVVNHPTAPADSLDRSN